MLTKVTKEVSNFDGCNHPARLSTSFKLPPFSLFLFYAINLAYYTLICPFKLSYDEVSSRVSAIRCTKLHKVRKKAQSNFTLLSERVNSKTTNGACPLLISITGTLPNSSHSPSAPYFADGITTNAFHFIA